MFLQYEALDDSISDSNTPHIPEQVATQVPFDRALGDEMSTSVMQIQVSFLNNHPPESKC